MATYPEASRLEDLIKVEAEEVKRSIWVLDSADITYEITQSDFLEVTLQNLRREIDFRFIFPDSGPARKYWEGIYKAARNSLDNPHFLSLLQARFLPKSLLAPVSDFVYSAQIN